MLPACYVCTPKSELLQIITNLAVATPTTGGVGAICVDIDVVVGLALEYARGRGRRDCSASYSKLQATVVVRFVCPRAQRRPRAG